MSGTIKSSDAEQLWTESRSIREWSADHIAHLTAIINSLETRVKDVEKYNTSLHKENSELIEIIEKLRSDLASARSVIDDLTYKLSTLKKRKDHS